MQFGTFARIFWYCGLSFGLFQFVATLVQSRSFVAAAFIGVAAGIFFGATMGLTLTALSRWAMKRRGIERGKGGTGVDVSDGVLLPLPPQQALERCRAALAANRGLKEVRVDPARGAAYAHGRLSWASFGEKIECRVAAVEDGSWVTIRSRPVLSTTVVDYGKNRENVQRIRTLLLDGAPALAASRG
ncbi:hypothetical protein [Longimicrobium sp.]|uniref:hypothetical protein n=1 Tax=Longimicrobium sp. TaxID=2029185 RepID=UPI003B3A3632